MQSRTSPYFLFGVIGLCLLYFCFEIFFNGYAILSVDDFWFSHNVYQYKTQLPYRDFPPYKTVLGYYLLLIPMLFTQGTLNALIFTKNSIALFNSVLFLICALWLTRFFPRITVLASLSLLLCTEIVLSYSTNIRVDLIAYWFCFFSLLFLLDKRFILAGLLIGLGFITSQKSIWCMFASNIALMAYWMIAERSSRTFWNIILFNCTAFAIILFYLAFWAGVSSWSTVLNSVFFEAYAMYQLDWYNEARGLFWGSILNYNPLLFLLWPLTLITLFISPANNDQYHRRVLIVTYASTILFCLIFYKQVFPYYMQVTHPVFFTLYAAFFTWLLAIFDSPPNHVSETAKPQLTFYLIDNASLWFLLIAYSALIVGAKFIFDLPYAYLLLCLLPLILGFYITTNNYSKTVSSICFNLICIIVVFVGAIYPIASYIPKVLDMNGSYQKANIQVMNTLLEDGSDYIAGVDFFYNKNQPIAGMRHLMGPAIDYLRFPSEKLRTVMLPSLYEDPNVTVDSVINAIQYSSVKFYVNNYRMIALPENLLQYLNAEYTHYWGSIYLYAPTITPGNHAIMVKFSGIYLIETHPKAQIILDNQSYEPNSIVHLMKGSHQSIATMSYRLKLIPERTKIGMKAQFQQDDWKNVVF